MKKSLVEATIKSKLDGAALLCWRILQDKGKLDEKHVCCGPSSAQVEIV